jgi:hypothetical protein
MSKNDEWTLTPFVQITCYKGTTLEIIALSAVENHFIGLDRDQCSAGFGLAARAGTMILRRRCSGTLPTPHGRNAILFRIIKLLRGLVAISG